MSADIGLERIAEGLVVAAAVDPRSLSHAAKCERVTVLQHLSHRLAAEITRTVHDWEQSGAWAEDGSRTSTTRLARDGHTSEGTARAVLSRGDRLTKAPAVAASFAAGDLSTDQVDLLLAAAIGREPLFARDEAMLVGLATELRVRQLVTALRYWQDRADAELGRDGPEPNTASSLKIATGPDGTVYLEGQLDPIGGKLVSTAIEQIAAELAKADEAAGRPARLKTDLHAAALIEMARRAMANPAGQPARIAMNIACGHEAFSRLCELSNGVVIRPAQIVPYLSALDIRTIVFDKANRAVATSTRRTFVGSLRDIIEVRDRHCQHSSGCDIPADGCDVDHIQPWPSPTSQDNGRLLCVYHNRIEPQRTTPPAKAATKNAGVDPP